jgi:hypothetical protein
MILIRGNNHVIATHQPPFGARRDQRQDQMIFRYAVFIMLAVPAIIADAAESPDMGKLLATAGVIQIEGAGGGGLAATGVTKVAQFGARSGHGIDYYIAATSTS